jgi:hypothetical protein
MLPNFFMIIETYRQYIPSFVAGFFGALACLVVVISLSVAAVRS